MPVKLGFIILSLIGVLRIPEEFYLYKDKDRWNELRSVLRVKTNAEVAKILLDWQVQCLHFNDENKSYIVADRSYKFIP